MKVFKKILYNVRETIRTIKTFQNWITVVLVRLHLGKKPVIVKLRNGAKFKIRRNRWDAYIVRETFTDKVYHKGIAQLGENSVLIDIGANIGTFAVFAAIQNKKIKVYSYEPFEENFLLLKENVALNGLEQEIKTFNCAIGDTECEKEVFLKDSNATSSLYEKDGKEVRIKVITLKDVFVDNNIQTCDLLKVDCEGAEYEIFYSTPSDIFDKIKMITMEYHEEYGTGTREELKTFLEKQGFQVSMQKETQTRGYIYAEKPAKVSGQ